MATQVEKAVQPQLAAVQEQRGTTMPWSTGRGLRAMWSEGQDAATGSATSASGNALAYKGTAASSSGSVGAASGRGPTADPWTSQSCAWPWPVEFHEMIEDIAKAHKFFHASEHDVAAAQQHKAEC